MYLREGRRITLPQETEAMEVAAALMFFTALAWFIQQFDRQTW